jgi:hypothetical protein
MSAFVWKRGHTIAVVAAAVLAGGGVATGSALSGSPKSGTGPTASTSASIQPTSSPTVARSSTPRPKRVDALTGEKVSDHPVIAVKIENIYPARPQVGLDAADVVTVEQVEGRLTRLFAVYHTTFPARLGPVRSARNTDVELLPLFGKPGLVYSGANSHVQRNIDRASIVPLPRSTRDFRRPAPHNVFVNLRSIESSTKLPAARPIGWTFAASDARWQAARPGRSVTTSVGGDSFSFGYAKGRYTVRWKGQPYRDGDSGQVSRTDNVVILSVHNHPDGNADVNGAASVKSGTVGHGKVTLYRDGKKRSGTWERKSAAGPMTFRDSAGRDIPLAPGKTWLLLRG